MSLSLPPILPPGFSDPQPLPGSEGEVWRVLYGGEPCVLRFADSDSARDVDQAWAELAGLSGLEPHPGLAQLIEHGELDGRLWLAREWIEGPSLAELVRRGLSHQHLGILALRLCEALEVLHTAGWVHADVKAENIIVRMAEDEPGQPVLTDLGSTRLSGSVRDTTGGSFFAMAPEALLGAELDGRADVFAVGVMLASLLLPELRVHVAEFYARFPGQVGFFEATGLPKGELPDWASGLVERCVARAPADRPQSALEVGSEIARSLGLPRPRDRRSSAFKFGPRSGREQWFKEFAESAAAYSAAGAAATCLRVGSSEPLEAFERELRLGVALAGVPVHSAKFEPRKLEDVQALDRWITNALPESARVVFVLDDARVESFSGPWPERALAELHKTARTRTDLQLVRIARASLSGTPSPQDSDSQKGDWEEVDVPRLGAPQLTQLLTERLENSEDQERVKAFASRLDRDALGDWTRVNEGLRVAAERGWLAPGERAPHLFAARFNEPLIPPSVFAHQVEISAEARQLLGALKAREGRLQFRKLASMLGFEDGQCASIESELLRSGLAKRSAGRLLLTELGEAAAWVPTKNFLDTDLARIFSVEADLREGEGEERGEILLLRLRAGESKACRRLCEFAARTRERGAPARALDWLQRALDSGVVAADERSHLLGEWCLTQAALGRPDRALDACRELDEDGAAGTAARIRARVFTLRRDFEAAQREWENAAVVPGAGEEEQREVLFGKVRLLAEQARLAELEGLVREMLSGKFGELDPRRLLNARNLLATTRVRHEASPSALGELRALLREARAAEDGALEAGIALNLGTALRRAGGEEGLGEALGLFERACELQAEDGHLPGLAQSRAALGGTLREAGRVTEALAALRSALALRERLGDDRGAAGARGMLGLALADRGEIGSAVSELDRAARELSEDYGLAKAAELFSSRAELVRARLGRREQIHFDPELFDTELDDPRIALVLGRAAAFRGRILEAEEAWRAADEAAQVKGWGTASIEARFLLSLVVSEDHEAVVAPAVESPQVDARLLEEIRKSERASGNSGDGLLRLAREFEGMGRRDRAARAWYALARRTDDRERAEHARAAAEREFRACARGLSETEEERLKKSLLSFPDPRPSDMEGRSFARDERREAELQALLDIQSRLVDQEDLPSLLGKIVECALEIAGGERGFLLLEEEGELVFDTALDSRRGEDIAAPEVEVSRSVVRRALEVARPIRLSNATTDPLLGAAPSVTALELRSILCIPFDVQPRLRGVIYLDHRLRTGAFGDRAEELLMHLAGQAALAIRQVRRVAEIRRLNEKLSRRVIDAEADLQSARRALEDAGLASIQKSGLVGRSEGIRSVRSLLERAAPSRLPVLIQGQSGTGKELAARALHEQSGTRRSGAFVSESCAALPESLIESELFGYRRGAFTGAEEDRPGIFERADGGTLFLDEIGELPLDLQSKLLRVLETGRVRRLGDAEELRVDFRLVAATNRDLEREVAEGRFRPDLLYRLDALRVQMPPLVTRLEDIPLLVEHFLKRESDLAEGSRLRRVSDSVMAALCRRSWPGNVRELSNEVARLCVLSEGDLVDAELVRTPAPGSVEAASGGIETLEIVERRVILAAVEACGDDKRRAAKELGISRAKIYQKLKAWRSRGLIE